MRPTTRPRNTLFLACALLLALPGCEAMRRVDILDRVFEPERFRPRNPPAVAAMQPSVALAPPAALVKEPVAEAAPLPDPMPEPVRAVELPPVPRAADPPPRAPDPPPRALTPPPAAPQAEETPQAADSPTRTAFLLRENPWLTRFWSELNGEQQGRVTRALSRRGGAAEASATWDTLGLNDRVTLVFGPGRARS